MTGITVNMMVALVPLLTDSTRNYLGMLYPYPEPVSVFWYGGCEQVAFVHRMWDPMSTNYLKMHWTYDGMGGPIVWESYERFDSVLYDGNPYGMGGTPGSGWSSGAPMWPLASFYGSSLPYWAGMCAMTVDRDSGAYGDTSNAGSGHVLQRTLQDGNVIVGSSNGWLAVYDPVSGTWVSNPQQYITGHTLQGVMFDWFSNTIYIGTLNYGTEEFEYFTGTWDGINLSVNPTPTVIDVPVDPTYNTFWCGDWTLNYPDGGTASRPSVLASASAPVAEFAKILCYGDGVNQVILPTVLPTGDTLQAFIPYSLQIASEPNTGHVLAVWSQVVEWRTDQTYGWANYDIFYSVSQDNGATWSDPVNLTNENPKIAHFCPKIPEHFWNGRVWLAWGLETHDNTDPWWDAETGQDPPLHGMPFYLYLGIADRIGVSENSRPDQTFSYRMIGKTLVLSGLPANMKASARVYDILGRELRAGEGTGELGISMDGLAAGAYIFRVEADKFCAMGKVIVTR